MDTSSSMTKLHVGDSERADSGKYKIVATNEYGTDSAEIQVTVVSRPGPPGGPLMTPEVTHDSVSLTWHPPADNGGSPITGK